VLIAYGENPGEQRLRQLGVGCKPSRVRIPHPPLLRLGKHLQFNLEILVQWGFGLSFGLSFALSWFEVRADPLPR
jgi:hypothetical protein